MLPLGKQNMLGKETQPNEMLKASPEWNSQVSGRGTEQDREWGFAEESSLLSENTPLTVLERERKGFAMKSQSLQKNVSTVAPPFLQLKLNLLFLSKSYFHSSN